MVDLWVIYAFAGFLAYFFVNFFFKFISSENPIVASMIVYGAAAIVMLVLALQKMDFSINAKSALIAALAGFASVTGTIFALKSMQLAPNPGYSTAIFSANFVLLTIVSIFFFGSELTLIKGLGLLATLIGLVLLSI